MQNPCFVLCHELFDALPIHSFQMNNQRQWCEKVVALEEGQLTFTLTEGPTENVVNKL